MKQKASRKDIIFRTFSFVCILLSVYGPAKQESFVKNKRSKLQTIDYGSIMKTYIEKRGQDSPVLFRDYC